jgi:hypothetical protein
LSCFQHVPSIPWESWKPPRELERAAPRPVRLTGEGTAICLVSVFPIVGGAALGIGTAREDFRRDAEEAAAARRIFAAARLLPLLRVSAAGMRHLPGQLRRQPQPAARGAGYLRPMRPGRPQPDRYLPA